MTQPTVLDSATHRDIRVLTQRGAQYGEAVHLVPVIAEELRSLCIDYPVCFTKDDQTGQFGLYALLGFSRGENLYLNGEHWNASYLPLHVRRQPFLVASQQNADEPLRRVAMIDLDSPRVTSGGEKGEAIYNSDGTPTEYFKRMQSLLSTLINGAQATTEFINALRDNNLIEAAKISITLDDGERKNYDGLYTINEQALAELEGETLATFHQRGYLQACHLMLAAIGNINKLIQQKKARRS
ncbi:SapC family protein [Gilvimarinus japonicus]|uniref:SapC family protein n=1 Tax=Gilvimarinus japonicus TaxID=1796469 RepID=A0ABV7HSC4_9GAMM